MSVATRRRTRYRTYREYRTKRWDEQIQPNQLRPCRRSSLMNQMDCFGDSLTVSGLGWPPERWLVRQRQMRRQQETRKTRSQSERRQSRLEQRLSLTSCQYQRQRKRLMRCLTWTSRQQRLKLQLRRRRGRRLQCHRQKLQRQTQSD